MPSTPIFVVFQQNKVWVCTSESDATSLANATVYRVSGAPKKQQLVTITGAATPYTFTAVAGVKVGLRPAKENGLN